MESTGKRNKVGEKRKIQDNLSANTAKKRRYRENIRKDPTRYEEQKLLHNYWKTHYLG